MSENFIGDTVPGGIRTVIIGDNASLDRET